MSRSRRTHAQFAIRVKGELAAFLQSLPNASEFIRRAVANHAGRACPLCRGTGHVTCGIAEHFAEEARRARLLVPVSDDHTEQAPTRRNAPRRRRRS